MTTYEIPGCAYCPDTVRACRVGEGDERGPGFCPSKVDAEGIAGADAYRRDPFIERAARVSAVVESEGYCKWTRVFSAIAEQARRGSPARIGGAEKAIAGARWAGERSKAVTVMLIRAASARRAPSTTARTCQ